MSTAEPWHVWILYPELAEHVDYIAVHMLRFFHVERLARFKAGALTFALRHTDPRAEIVAVIDADYVVESGWLRDLVPAFASERTGLVQAPQDYRDAGESAFKAMWHAEYRASSTSAWSRATSATRSSSTTR